MPVSRTPAARALAPTRTAAAQTAPQTAAHAAPPTTPQTAAKAPVGSPVRRSAAQPPQQPQQPPTAREASCAAVCRALAEPMAGTAPAAASGWLLIEHPGPWPAFGLPPELPAPLREYARTALDAGVRTQLIRRPDRAGRAAATARIMIAGGTPDSRWLEQFPAEDVLKLCTLAPTAFAEKRAPGMGTRVESALLVCTHGRREVCCAQYGRPVARALAERFGALVWETTHVGGDRFAASVVALPSGAYFGRLDPNTAVRVLKRHMTGVIDLDHYRGTAGMPAAAQAAEAFLRRRLRADQTGAVRFVSHAPEFGYTAAGPTSTSTSTSASVTTTTTSTSTSTSTSTTRFSVSPALAEECATAQATDARGRPVHIDVTVAEHPATCPRLTSCGERTVEQPTSYRLVSISR